MDEQDRPRRVRDLAAAFAGIRGPLLPALHAVQDEWGWISREDVEVLADVLGLSVAEVVGVVSFYHDFRTAPPPAHSLRVCRGEACQSVGGQHLHDAMRTHLAGRDDIEVGEVFCLGDCALGPAAVLDGRLHGRLTPERLAALVATTDGSGR